MLELLSAICYLDGGHDKVLKAINHYKVYADERVRLQVWTFFVKLLFLLEKKSF